MNVLCRFGPYQLFSVYSLSIFQSNSEITNSNGTKWLLRPILGDLEQFKNQDIQFHQEFLQKEMGFFLIMSSIFSFFYNLISKNVLNPNLLILTPIQCFRRNRWYYVANFPAKVKGFT